MLTSPCRERALAADLTVERSVMSEAACESFTCHISELALPADLRRCCVGRSDELKYANNRRLIKAAWFDAPRLSVVATIAAMRLKHH